MGRFITWAAVMLLGLYPRWPNDPIGPKLVTSHKGGMKQKRGWLIPHGLSKGNETSLQEGVETFSIGRVLGLLGCGAHENSTVKRAQVAAIQGWVTFLGSFHPGNQKQIREPGGAERTISNTAGCYRCGGGIPLQRGWLIPHGLSKGNKTSLQEGVETFSIGRVLGLVGCGAYENSTVKSAQVAAIQGWVTSLGSFHPGNQKQIREPGGAERTISNTAGCYRWYQRQGPNPCDQRGR
ncbi:hypothetical protein E3N88_09991 [Mikania micrantha]|uniref:Uncharacterized protein n=1 Tax=Mikania micrantha TaxID=192012 RepID=A0A5N6P9E9_9ASTR|nr:hypothetical protein E3N88_09991 [Mikania micrantha]